MLHTYEQVFVVPCGLPPLRSHNHAIPLVHGSNPIKVKSYWYPFSQKQQIEKMIQEMLQEGIIVPSNSIFFISNYIGEKERRHVEILQ